MDTFINFQDVENDFDRNDFIASQDSDSSISSDKINNASSSNPMQKSGIEKIEDLDKFISNKEEIYKTFAQFKNIITQKLATKSYSLQKYLTCGGEGIVFVGKQNNEQEQQSFIVKINFDCKEEEILEEIKIMKIFEQNINVIQFIDSLRVTDQIYIFILERCKCSLFDELQQIIDEGLEFSQQKLLQMIFDLLDGLIQLRIYNILHLDIKPKNILVSQSGNYLYSDFGISQIKTQNNILNIKGKTTYFASPEQKSENPNIGFSSDIYSLGKTFQKIFEAYKNINKFDRDIDTFEKIVEENMINEEYSKRKTCLQLHKIFFDISLTMQQSFFIQEYSNKIKKLVTLIPYDPNKDYSYYQNLKLYYSTIKLESFNKFIKPEEKNYYEIASQLNFIGQCYINRGELQQGLEKILKSLQFRKKLQLQNQSEIAESLNNIGQCYKLLGNYEDALLYLQQSLDMRKQHQEQSDEIAQSLNNIGLCYQDLGNFQCALQYAHDSLDMRKILFKLNFPDISDSIDKITVCFCKLCIPLNDTLDNEDQEIVKIRFNKNHPDIIESLNNIADSLNSVGLCYQLCGDLKNALKHHNQSLIMRKQIFNENHPDIADSLSNIGLCYQVFQYPLDALV